MRFSLKAGWKLLLVFGVFADGRERRVLRALTSPSLLATLQITKLLLLAITQHLQLQMPQGGLSLSEALASAIDQLDR